MISTKPSACHEIWRGVVGQSAKKMSAQGSEFDEFGIMARILALELFPGVASRHARPHQLATQEVCCNASVLLATLLTCPSRRVRDNRRDQVPNLIELIEH